MSYAGRRLRPMGSPGEFRAHLRRKGFLAIVVLAGSLAIGAVGYHLTEGIPWLDAALNASMLLAGEGPIGALHSTAGKLFATFYALFSGIAFVTAVGVVGAPVLHHFLHRVHLDITEETGETSPAAPPPERPGL